MFFVIVGTSNILSSFVNAYPSTGSFSRCSLTLFVLRRCLEYIELINYILIKTAKLGLKLVSLRLVKLVRL